jgi:endoglycosylceramidase
MNNWKRERSKDIKFQNCPIIIGEIGLSPDLPGFDEFLDDAFDYTDQVEGGWSYWFNSRGGWGPLNPDGTPSPILPQLVRAYPKAVQGRIENTSFDRESKVFTLRFKPLPSISQPTEIFIPELHYPSGYDLNVEGSSDYRTEYDAGRQLLKLYANTNDPMTVTITAK